MNLDKKISFPPHIMFQPFDDEAILLDIRTQEHFGLDPIASLFLTHLQNDKSPKEILSLILDEYDVTEEQLQTDINVLLDTLLKHELIELS